VEISRKHDTTTAMRGAGPTVNSPVGIERKTKVELYAASLECAKKDREFREFCSERR